MKQYKYYLIDLDGTMYRGNKPIEYASEFIQKLSYKRIPYLFLTNNSTKTPTQVSNKLKSMGIDAASKDIFTSSMATAKYIKQLNAQAHCYVIGEQGLYHALEQEGLKIVNNNSDYVVMGLDSDVTYTTLMEACQDIWNGAGFMATNADTAIPTERGLAPGNGALTSVITASTGQKPIFIGKPETTIMNQALDELGADRHNTLMIGDNYDTDIMAGINSSMDTLMVFTGITSPHDYSSISLKPTYHAHNLGEWLPYI